MSDIDALTEQIRFALERHRARIVEVRAELVELEVDEARIVAAGNALADPNAAYPRRWIMPIDFAPTDFIEVAMGSKARNAEKWRYFCGCCWKELSNRTELARRMVEDGE